MASLFTRMTIWGALLLSGFSAWSLIDLSTQPMSRESLIGLITAHPEVTKLDQVPAILPGDFRMNFILKHGIRRTGERGHLNEQKISQSADPLAPRAILFDERSGLSVSWNGGNPEQLANQRLDVMSFNSKDKTFSLEQIDFPIQPGQPRLTYSDCKSCHGPHQRPIFAMYPDWPAFYGSDNDELTGTVAVQKAEMKDYVTFRSKVAAQHPRYAPLFDSANVAKYLGVKIYSSFPYRPDTSEKVRDVSRSFAFRPELRMGVLYNRLNAQNIVARINAHPRYREFAPYFMFNMLQCSWPSGFEHAQKSWQEKFTQMTGQKARVVGGGLLDYRQNLSIFDLKVNDLDIRYSYNHEGYNNLDASKKVMEVGYIGRYFNSYFDGSATIDELIVAAMYNDLSVGRVPELRGITQPWGLTDKYKHLTERYKYDQAFFTQMDKLGKWIHIPFPASLAQVHHREKFTAEFGMAHQKLCATLAQALK